MKLQTKSSNLRVPSPISRSDDMLTGLKHPKSVNVFWGVFLSFFQLQFKSTPITPILQEHPRHTKQKN